MSLTLFLASSPMTWGENPLNPTGGGYDYFMTILLLMLLFLVLLQSTSILKRKPPKTFKTITRIECLPKGDISEREFQRGDYVGKVLGACDDGGKLVITAIYEVEENKKTGTRVKLLNPRSS